MSAKIEKYRIKEDGTNAGGHPAGTVCYSCKCHDYGLASDDTRMTGIEHASVTLSPEGDYPFFTIRKSSLEKTA
jgi:hypothetical protein